MGSKRGVRLLYLCFFIIKLWASVFYARSSWSSVPQIFPKTFLLGVIAFVHNWWSQTVQKYLLLYSGLSCNHNNSSESSSNLWSTVNSTFQSAHPQLCDTVPRVSLENVCCFFAAVPAHRVHFFTCALARQQGSSFIRRQQFGTRKQNPAVLTHYL